MKHKFTIEYALGTYEGTEVVYLNADDDRDPRMVMWARLNKLTTLPMAARSAKIIKHERVDDED